MDNSISLNLRKFLAPEIVYGAGALELAGRHAMNLGATKVLLVTDPGVQAAGWASKVQACLEESAIAYATFDAVTPNPKDHEVMAGAEVYNEQGCDLIIAVGGGSPMDCAKGIGVVAGNAILLELVVPYNYSVAGEKYDRLAKAMGLDIEAHDVSQRASKLAEQVAALRTELGITKHLVDMGVTQSDLPGLARFAHQDPCLATNPCEATPEDIETIFRKIYQ